LAQLAEARLLYDTAGDPLRVAGTELDAAGIAANIGRQHEALSYLTRAEGTFQAFGARDQLAFAQATHAMTALALLNNPAALQLSDRFWPPEAWVNNDRTRNFLTLARAFALLRNGRLAEAGALFARVLAVADAPQHTQARRNATLGLAEAALQRGQSAR